MTRFGEILKYLDFFKTCKSEDVGIVTGIGANVGWSYSEKVMAFLQALRKIKFRWNRYDILKYDNIDFWKVDFDNEDFTKYSVKVLVSLMQIADDWERICDGLFHSLWEKGWIVKILEILKTKDYQYMPYQFRSKNVNKFAILKFIGNEEDYIVCSGLCSMLYCKECNKNGECNKEKMRLFLKGKEYRAYFLDYCQGERNVLEVAGENDRLETFIPISDFEIISDDYQILQDKYAIAKCVKSNGQMDLTLNKNYKILKKLPNKNHFYVLDDSCDCYYYPSDNFEIIEDKYGLLKDKEETNWRYGVVANIKMSLLDENGVLRYGTKPYTAGTKVYLEGKFWNSDCKQIGVIGINRFGRIAFEYIEVNCIESLRAKKIYNPLVLKIIDNIESLDGKTWWGNTSEDKKETEEFVKTFNDKKGV